MDPTDPEVYQVRLSRPPTRPGNARSPPPLLQTLASVRLSQQREEDAKAALTQGWELWRNLEPGAQPSLARLPAASC